MTTHKEVSNLLPWYVNGSLHSQEMVLVEEHLKDCPICAAAVSRELHIAREIQPQAADDRRINSLLASQHENFAVLRDNLATADSRPKKLLLGLCASAAAVIFAVFVVAWQQPGERLFIPMTQSPAAAGAEPVIQLAFDATTTEPQMRHLILQVGGNLVGAPTDTGIYRIVLHEDSDVAAVLDYLHAQPVVSWATVEQ